jgi:hypothetical protein
MYRTVVFSHEWIQALLSPLPNDKSDVVTKSSDGNGPVIGKVPQNFQTNILPGS